MISQCKWTILQKKLRDSQSSGTVTPLRVNPDGTLRVTTEAGLTKDLTTDYLF